MPVVFTERELDIMAVLWEYGPSTVAQVRAKLVDAPSHNTIATILTILENKGRVAHVEEGRAFRFRPLVGREDAGRSAFARLVETVFAGSAESLIMHFVRDQRLTKSELERLRMLLDRRIAETPERRPAAAHRSA
jgi:predicted transcriptional regulator